MRSIQDNGSKSDHDHPKCTVATLAPPFGLDYLPPAHSHAFTVTLVHSYTRHMSMHLSFRLIPMTHNFVETKSKASSGDSKNCKSKMSRHIYTLSLFGDNTRTLLLDCSIRIVVVPVVQSTQQHLPDVAIPIGVIHDIPNFREQLVSQWITEVGTKPTYMPISLRPRPWSSSSSLSILA